MDEMQHNFADVTVSVRILSTQKREKERNVVKLQTYNSGNKILNPDHMFFVLYDTFIHEIFSARPPKQQNLHSSTGFFLGSDLMLTIINPDFCKRITE